MGYDMLLTTNWDAHPSREHKTKLGPMIVPCLMFRSFTQLRKKQQQLGMIYTVWWFGTCFIFPYIGNIVIPTDELIFFRGVGQPTNFG